MANREQDVPKRKKQSELSKSDTGNAGEKTSPKKKVSSEADQGRRPKKKVNSETSQENRPKPKKKVNPEATQEKKPKKKVNPEMAQETRPKPKKKANPEATQEKKPKKKVNPENLVKPEATEEPQPKVKKWGRRKLKFAILVAACLMVALLCSYAAVSANSVPRIWIKANSAEIMQYEDLPELQIHTTINNEKYEDIVLDDMTGYTVEALLKDINEGKYYSISCEADSSADGNYPIVVDATPELMEKISKEWSNKVVILTEDSNLKVTNMTGKWNGNKFERYDGTFVTNDFIQSGDAKYYFDENGDRVTGIQEINGYGYWFNDEGVMQTGWREADGEKYYYTEDGKMQIGWLKMDDDKYCFDEDGKMLTGKQQVGSQKCVFEDDGRLKSAKSNIDDSKPMVALTFDDGPGKRTMELLEVLEEYDAHATFFMLGQNAEIYQDEIEKMYDIGCELGNHSYSHANLSTLDEKGVMTQMGDTNAAIKEADGKHTATVMRPPYGAINSTVEKNVGMPIILWSIDTLDWETRDADKTVDAIMDNVEDGDIVLLHDIHSETIDAAIEAIPKLIAEGYQLVTVTEMAEAKGYFMEAGETYTDFYPKDRKSDN